ncbi:cdc42 homolog [Babylonia areolata]|uniref:cdc42 homolog n=1 Tax=Babylonia areolata TaxID=304850 RepID=UPI003FD4FE82
MRAKSLKMRRGRGRLSSDSSGEEGEEGGGENYVHCAVLGDGGVGKTSLTLGYTQNCFPASHTATVFDNYSVPVEVGGEDFVISLFDTSGHTNHESLRAFTYERSEVVVVCFSLCDRQSFYNVLHCWLPEIQRHSQRRLPVLLVGTQKDLRRTWPADSQHVSSEEGQYVARVIGADCYIECSAKSREGVEEVFHHVIFSALKYRVKKRKIFTRLFGDFSLYDRLKNLSPPRIFETSSLSC